MNERGKRQASSLFGGMGFYIALLCCVLAAGVVGYYALLNDDTTQNQTDDTPAGGSAAIDPGQTVDQTDPGPSQSVATPDPGSSLPVMGGQTGGKDTKPSVTIPEPPTTGTEPLGTEPVPDAGTPENTVPTMGQEPIPAQEPLRVTSPLAGETVAVFSVDALTYDATMGDWRTHDGIDIQAAAGTQVAAAAAGTVRSVEQDDRLGTTIIIDHVDGYATTYASLQPEVSVKPGDTVKAGDVIGTVGNTSLVESALGAHLHFSVAKDGTLLDPTEFLEQNSGD